MRFEIGPNAVDRLLNSPETTEAMKRMAEERLRSIECPVHRTTAPGLHLVDTPTFRRYKVEGDVCCVELENAVAEAMGLGPSAG